MDVNTFIEKDGKKVYRASNPVSKDPSRPGNEPMWIEISISSAVAEEVFQQNQKLKIGEQTAWKVDDLLKKAVPSFIYFSACALVRRMDGIGFDNDNGWVNQRESPTMEDPW
jgi:hypothetical protein